MSRLDDIKDQVQTQLRQVWDKIQETTIYVDLKDRYETLSARSQKMVSIIAAVCVLIFLLSFVYLPYSTSQENITSFETKRTLMRDLIRVQRESSVSSISLPTPPDFGSLQAQIDNFLKSSGLIPSQMKGVTTVQTQGRLIPESVTQSVMDVSIQKLTLKQVVDIGHRLANLNPSVKLKDFEMVANAEDPNYYDTHWFLYSLKIPQKPVAPPEEPKKGRNSKKDNGNE